MEPENIDWDNVDSIFVRDDAYEDFDAPKWVDFSALDDLIDDEDWFCNHDCEHSKTAKDGVKRTSNSKAKLLRFVTMSEFLPFRDRTPRDNSSVSESSYAKPEKSERPPCLKKLDEDIENKSPNLSTPVSDGGTNSLRKPIMKPKRDNPKTLGLDGSTENAVKSDRKSQLTSTFSSQNLLGGREILNQITEFYSGLKRLAMKSTKKGTSEKGRSEEPNETMQNRERMPMLRVKKSWTLNS